MYAQADTCVICWRQILQSVAKQSSSLHNHHQSRRHNKIFNLETGTRSLISKPTIGPRLTLHTIQSTTQSNFSFSPFTLSDNHLRRHVTAFSSPGIACIPSALHLPSPRYIRLLPILFQDPGAILVDEFLRLRKDEVFMYTWCLYESGGERPSPSCYL